MKINELADEVYLINLDRRKDRYDLSVEQMNNNNISFKRFAAVDGKNLPNDTYMNAGQYGNYLSHLRVVEECINNNVNTVAIFEDDIEFCENFEEKFSLIYEDIPSDWDMIYLGHNRHVGPNIPLDHNPQIVRIMNAYAIHAFILNKKAIETAYNFFSKTPFQADVYYAKLQYELNAYGFHEQLCSQRPDWSDIDEADVNNRWVFGWS